MVINEKTRISHLLKAHPDALQTIVKLSPDFKRLLNPVLRKLVAGRATIAMASKMGGVTPQDFYDALKPLGFEVDATSDSGDEVPENDPVPEYLKKLDPGMIVPFDVRKIIADGKDPLREITQKVKALDPGKSLKIITDFEPIPLVRLLEKQGFESYMEFIDKDTINTYFFKENQAEGDKNTIEIDEDTSSSDDWDGVLKQFEGNMEEIDVRHLEMPGPMMTILETLETLPDDKALYVNHKKVPVFLLSELKDRDYEYRIKDVQEGEVYLLIFKNK